MPTPSSEGRRGGAAGRSPAAGADLCPPCSQPHTDACTPTAPQPPPARMALPGWRTPGAGLAGLNVGLALLPHARPLRVLGRGQSRCTAGASAKIVLDFMAGLCQLGRTACTHGQPAKGPPTGLSRLCYCKSCPMQNGPLQRGPTF